MTKAEIVNEISKKTGIDKATVLTAVEAFMESVKESLIQKEDKMCIRDSLPFHTGDVSSLLFQTG